MIIPSISGISPIAASGATQLGNVTSVAASANPVPAGGMSFASQLDSLASMQANVDQLSVKAATGDLQSIQDYTIAATETQLMTQLTVTVRNKAVEAFNDIMKMQV